MNGRSRWQVVHGGGDAMPFGPCGRWQLMQPPLTLACTPVVRSWWHSAHARLTSVLCWSWQLVHVWCGGGALAASAAWQLAHGRFCVPPCGSWQLVQVL